MKQENGNEILKKLEQQSMVHNLKYRFFAYYFYLGVKVTQNIAQCLPPNVTYAPVKFEVAMSNG